MLGQLEGIHLKPLICTVEEEEPSMCLNCEPCRVYIGRYFHGIDFLGSTRKKHVSHTWRSILAGKEVIGRGLIRRIRDGTSTNFWQDRWIPLHFYARPITPIDDQEVSLVSELLTGFRQWNEDLIRAIFLPIDANAILRIPLRPQEGIGGHGNQRSMVNTR